MPASNDYGNKLLLAELNADFTGFTGIFQNASSPATFLHMSLHFAAPVAGDQTTNEVSFTGYVRPAIPRSSSGITISGLVGTLVANALFGLKTAGADVTITHVGFGRDITGTGLLMRYAAIAPFVTADGRTPRVLAGAQFTLV